MNELNSSSTISVNHGFWQRWYGNPFPIVIKFGTITGFMVLAASVLFDICEFYPIVGMLILMGMLPIVIGADLPMSTLFYG